MNLSGLGTACAGWLVFFHTRVSVSASSLCVKFPLVLLHHTAMSSGTGLIQTCCATTVTMVFLACKAQMLGTAGSSGGTLGI